MASNSKQVVKSEPLTEQDIKNLLALFSLKARLREKLRTPKQKALGDLILLQEIFK